MFKKPVNTFQRMEISKSIYKGVVEPSYKKNTRADVNRAGNSRQKRGEAASLLTCPEKCDSTGKFRKRHVDFLMGNSKIYLIHGTVNYSEECKVLGDFGTKYANIYDILVLTKGEWTDHTQKLELTLNKLK